MMFESAKLKDDDIFPSFLDCTLAPNAAAQVTEQLASVDETLRVERKEGSF